MSNLDWSQVFEHALPYEPFLEQYASASMRERWLTIYERTHLDDEQARLLDGFIRRMPVLVLAAGWCGDCLNQCPILARIARGSPRVDLRFLERDLNPAIRDELAINGGHRLPVVVFLSEDWYEVARRGDRTLSIYRRMAADELGSACPTGFVPPEDQVIRTITQEWIDEFERVQLLLRLSTRLRQRHAD